MKSSHRPGESQPEINSPEETQGTHETVPSGAASKPSCWDKRGTKDAWLIWDSAFPTEANGAVFTWKGHKVIANNCQCSCRAAEILSGLHMGSAWNTRPTWDCSSQSKQQGALTGWTQKVHATFVSAKPTAVHPAQEPPCFPTFSVPTLPMAPLSSWAWIRGCYTLTSEWKLDTEETCIQRN